MVGAAVANTLVILAVIAAVVGVVALAFWLVRRPKSRRG